jgi:UDP-glucose:(heptosyl)LPS alpha-1,3-glucosyltransferase
LKIALVHKRLDLNGGTERDLFKTAEGLRDLGHEVHLFCSEFGVSSPAGVRVHRVPVLPLGRTLRLWTFAWSAPRLIDGAGCEVIVGFGRLLHQDVLRSGGGTHRGFLERLAAQGGLRRRLWQNLSVYHQSLLQIEKRQFQTNGCAKIIAVSEEVKADILRHYPIPADKITVVHNGVDPERFNPKRRALSHESIRRQWNIPPDAPVVLFVGSGFRRKGLDRLLSIWHSPRLGAAFLVVVGDDARFDRYQSRAKGIAPERILFTGRRDDVEDCYAAADVVALPSLQEAFGNVVLEALASGLPVLVSRDAGAAELLRGRLTRGIVNRPDDAKELEEKLLFLLHHARDPHWTREARMIGEEHSWANHFKKLEAVLRATHGAPERVAF